MSQTPVVITPGTGGASIAAELVGATSFQQIEVYGGGGASVLGVNPDGSISASIIGTPTITFSGSPSISGTVNVAGLQGASVSGTVGASVIGLTPIVGSVQLVTGGGVVSGQAANVDNLSTANRILFTGAFVHGFNSAIGGWDRIRGDSVSGLVVQTGSSSVITILTGNPSISGTVNVAGLQGASVSGTVAATQQGAWTQSVVGAYAEPTVVTSITGMALVYKSNVSSSVMTAVSVANPLPVSVQGTIGASIIGTVPVTFASTANQSVSGTVGASIIGQLPGGNAVIGAVAASISGSVTVTGLQGASVSGTIIVSGLQGASISGTVNVGNAPSIYGNISGSVVGFQGGAWTTSVVGGPVTLYAPTTSYISGVTSVITGTSSVNLLVAPPGGQRNYITQVLVTNNAAASTVVNLLDGPNVIYAGVAAASGGGFSITFPAALRQATTSNLGVTSSVQASVFVSASGYTAP